jgi:hypothetical protein
MHGLESGQGQFPFPQPSGMIEVGVKNEVRPFLA